MKPKIKMHGGCIHECHLHILYILWSDFGTHLSFQTMVGDGRSYAEKDDFRGAAQDGQLEKLGSDT